LKARETIVPLRSGVKLRYAERGSGFPLVCIMGLGATMDLWSETFLEALASQHRVITFDNRGVGGSRGPPPRGITSYANDLVSLLDHLAIEQAHVLGISMGGMIAQQLAVKYAERVRCLMLGATTCAAKYVRPSRALFKILFFNIAPRHALRALLSADYLASHADQIDELIARMHRSAGSRAATLAQLTACRLFNLDAEVERITQATLLMTGTDDQIINPENTDILSQKIRGARVVKFPGVGHAFPLERERDTIDAILSFCTAEPGR